ncbi:MAG: methyltransferase domain-containing protein [Anaerolineae bacterium]|nr:methyltransferase domain-containing protein [Anaerolineae bacterium]
MSKQSIVFDRAADYYDETRGFPPGVSEQAAALIARAGGLGARSRVLEVGVGTGRIALPLATHVDAMIGIDLSSAMLARLLSKRRQERVFVAKGDITQLPLASRTFDATIAVHIFHLVADYPLALREIARALKPGGVLLHAWTEQDRSDALFDVWSQATGRQQRPEVGMSMDQRHASMLEHGWQLLGERMEMTYSTERAPNAYLESLRGRIWSHTWRMTDEELEQGLHKLQAYIEAHFDDPSQPVPVHSTFAVQTYRAPA